MSLHERLLARYLEAGLLYSLDLELTYRCPLRCLHCYQRGRHYDELSTDAWLDILAQARQMDVFNIGLTGGEIFVRSDLPVLLERAASLGLRIFANTSGSGATPETVQALIASRPARVDVSFYGGRAAVHDGVTGRVGSFAQSIALTHRLQAAGLFVRAAVTLLAGHAADRAAVADQLAGEGIGQVAFNRFDPTLCSHPDEVAHLQVPEDGSHPCQLATDEDGDASSRPVCGAGTSSLLIHPDGSVAPCHGLATVVGHVTRTPLAAIWSESQELQKLRSRRLSDLPHCSTCELWSECAFCPAEAQRRTGDWRQVSPEFCARRRGNR